MAFLTLSNTTVWPSWILLPRRLGSAQVRARWSPLDPPMALRAGVAAVRGDPGPVEGQPLAGWTRLRELPVSPATGKPPVDTG